MGEGKSAIVLEGDHTSRINEILKTFYYVDIQDFCEANNYNIKNGLYSKIGQDTKKGWKKYFLIIGIHKGWTVIEQIEPSICYLESCLRASSLINARVINMGYETHVGYTGLILSDKGRAVIHLEEDSFKLKINEGAPYPLSCVDDELHFEPYDIRKIIERTIGFNIFDLLSDKNSEKINKVWVKEAYKNTKIPQ